MKKFQFSLEKMLAYKESLLEEEKNKLMQIRARKNEIDTRIENAETQIETMDNERTTKAARGISILEMRSYSYSIENTRKLIKALQEEQIKLERQIEKQLAIVLEHTQEVSGLEKLREKQLEEYNYLVLKEQELIISEMISSKYVNQQMVSAQ